LLFRFVLGPYCPLSLRSAVEQAGAKLGAHRVRPEGFLPNFEEVLSRVSLSISLAGYNTVMNILSTRTPALVFPHRANREQILRAEKLAKLDLLRVLNEADLPPAALRVAIAQALHFRPSNVAVNLRGAQTTCALLAGRLPVTGPEAHR
jgi:predicted glycosyltransferase